MKKSSKKTQQKNMLSQIDGWKKSKIVYSFPGSRKKNNMQPFQWFKNVLSCISDCFIQKLVVLLSDNREKRPKNPLDGLIDG